MCKMTRQHFQVIADALKSSKPAPNAPLPEQVGWSVTVQTMAAHLAETNPAYKRDTFLAACGFDG